jgi:hypothetical protein
MWPIATVAVKSALANFPSKLPDIPSKWQAKIKTESRAKFQSQRKTSSLRMLPAIRARLHPCQKRGRREAPSSGRSRLMCPSGHADATDPLPAPFKPHARKLPGADRFFADRFPATLHEPSITYRPRPLNVENLSRGAPKNRSNDRTFHSTYTLIASKSFGRFLPSI